MVQTKHGIMGNKTKNKVINALVRKVYLLKWRTSSKDWYWQHIVCYPNDKPYNTRKDAWKGYKEMPKDADHKIKIVEVPLKHLKQDKWVFYYTKCQKKKS